MLLGKLSIHYVRNEQQEFCGFECCCGFWFFAPKDFNYSKRCDMIDRAIVSHEDDHKSKVA